MPDKVIYYIDDDSDDLATFLYVAKSLDINVMLFKRGDEILLQFENLERQPFAIFVDLNMPGMDGYEVIRKLAANPQIKSVPIIAFSTANDEHSVELAKDAGAACFISKPHTIAHLRETLYYVVDKNWSEISDHDGFHVKHYV